MERARATWTDERLDDLSHRVDHGFERVHKDLQSLNAQIDARFDAMSTESSRRFDTHGTEFAQRIDAQSSELAQRIDAQGSELSQRIDAQGQRIDALQRTMIQIGGAMGAGIFATLASVLATRV